MHDTHEQDEKKQVERQQGNGNIIRDQTEDRRHEAGAHIRACHLYTDDRL